MALVLSRPKVAGRLQKWSIELEEYAIHYRARVSVKGNILADLIVKQPEEDSLDTLMEVEEELLEPWILFTDGSSCTDGSGAGLILTNPEGMEFTYALRFSNGDTSFSLTYGTEVIIPADIRMPTLRTSEVDPAQNDEALGINLDLLEEKREQAAICKAKSKAKMEKYYNSKVQSASFKPGDLVYRKNDASRMEDTWKLGLNGKDRTKLRKHLERAHTS
uniref:Reverse transcriptase domain-containing protein n=1 Tax=Tanacetum cinerariifolium TaxID=118510 RepID=A0A699I6B9_TANCI|nr:reverse transcriptase domain-containing protein [Tanacetum cinerariifolium]